MDQIGYYVDEGSGKVCSTEVAPHGCHFEYKAEAEYKKVLIVADDDGEVLQELVFWPSLDSLSVAGVDVSRSVCMTSLAAQPEKKMEYPKELIAKAEYELHVFGRVSQDTGKKLLAEVVAWRNRFPEHEYRAQDECIALKLPHTV